MSITFVRRAFAVLVFLATLTTGVGTASAGTEAAEAPSSEPRAGLRFVGIELRAGGRIGRCTPSTPEPCANWVWTWQCGGDGTARLFRVRTYLAAADPSVVGFQLRARVVPRSGSAAGIPWTVDTETFTSRPTAVERLMDAKPVSEYLVLARRWELVVEARFDRQGRPDDVRIWRQSNPFDC